MGSNSTARGEIVASTRRSMPCSTNTCWGVLAIGDVLEHDDPLTDRDVGNPKSPRWPCDVLELPAGTLDENDDARHRLERVLIDDATEDGAGGGDRGARLLRLDRDRDEQHRREDQLGLASRRQLVSGRDETV